MKTSLQKLTVVALFLAATGCVGSGGALLSDSAPLGGRSGPPQRIASVTTNEALIEAEILVRSDKPESAWRVLTLARAKPGLTADDFALLYIARGDANMFWKKWAAAATDYELAYNKYTLKNERRGDHDLIYRIHIALDQAGSPEAQTWKAMVRYPHNADIDEIREELLAKDVSPRSYSTSPLGFIPSDPRLIDPSIKTRSQWQARDIRGSYDDMGGIRRVTVHHAGCCSGADSTWEATQALQNIQKDHQDANGWADIGYHFVIDQSGRIWEGRNLKYQGAHAGNPTLNQENVGICLLGNFDREPVLDPQKNALRSLLDTLSAQFEIDKPGVVTHQEIRPQPTSCPGTTLQRFMESYRSSFGFTSTLQ